MTATLESAQAGSAQGQPTTGAAELNAVFTPERIQNLLEALAEPFALDVVEWRVTNTSGKRGQVVAYADQRAYTDRLNELFTPAGWTREYSVQTVQNFEVPRKDGKSTIITAKVMVTSKVTIYGLGAHSGTGEEWAIDENALTRAEAQAFKRACVCFGLGRYFYDLPRTWVELDQNRRPIELPKLPYWALPKDATNGSRRSNAAAPTQQPSSKIGRNGRSGAGNSAGGRSRNGNNPQPARGLYADELRQAVGSLAEEVGFSLSRAVFQAVAGVEELDAIRNHAHLTSVMDKLTDLSRGIARLRAATAKAGAAVYTRLCEELNLASDSIDDIPDRETLRQLVDRMEAAAAQVDEQDSGGVVDGEHKASNGANGATIGHLRGRLLIEARRVSAAQRKSLGEVIAEASHGSFTLQELMKLTDADAGSVEAALQELVLSAS